MSTSPSAIHHDVFKAVADPTRRAILDALRQGEQPVADIAAGFAMSRPAVSKHLRLLKQAKLVVEYRDGRNRIYSLDPRPLARVDVWLESYRPMLRSMLARLKDHVESQARENKSREIKARER